MHIAVVGSGAVGGFYGAKLAHAGARVTFIARGAHEKAIRERGLMIWSPLGDFQIHATVEHDTRAVGPVDVVLVAVKNYALEEAGALLPALVGPKTMVVTLQNGVDAPELVARFVGHEHVVGGAAYIASAVIAPGIIEQTGTVRRIAFGEVFDAGAEVSSRVRELADVLLKADIQAEAFPDARVPLWEKYIFLTALAGFSAAARVPTGGVWGDPHIRGLVITAMGELERLARAEGVPVAQDIVDRITKYCDALPATMTPSMLADLRAGKSLEVEALHGAAVRRAAARGLAVPVVSTLYGVIKPHTNGRQLG